MGYDIKSLKGLLDELPLKKKSKKVGDSVDQNLEVLLRDMENIDRILGLSITHKYYLARKK